MIINERHYRLWIQIVEKLNKNIAIVKHKKNKSTKPKTTVISTHKFNKSKE